jgi:hypothetical protein
MHFGLAMMKPIAALLLASTFVVVGAGEPGPDAKDKKARKPNFTIGKETTYVTGPVDKDGYIDYAAALNERLGKGVTPETNANVLIWKALGPKPDGGKGEPAAFFKLLGMEEPPEKGVYFVSYKKFAETKNEQEAFGKDVNPFGKQPWTVADFPARAKWLKANESALNLIVDATKRERHFSPLVPSALGLISAHIPSLQSLHEAAKALTARAMLRITEGQSNDAWSDLIACHRLGRLIGQSATLVEGLIAARFAGVAQSSELAFLNHTRLDSAQLQTCLKDLRELPPLHTLDKQLDTERFMVLESMMLTDRHGPWYIDQIIGLPGSEQRLPKTRLTNIDWDPSLRNANQCYDQLISISLEKDHAVRERRYKEYQSECQELRRKHSNINDIPKEYLKRALSPKAGGELLGDWLLIIQRPGAWRAQQSIDRTEQSMRNLQIAFALVAHERDNKSYPKTLDALAPKYLPKVPDDLFTGKPLVYRPTEKGFLLYSFGPDGKDDEGRGTKDEPEGDDIAIRIPVAKPGKK